MKSEISLIELNYLKKLLTKILIKTTHLDGKKIYAKINSYDNHSTIYIDTREQSNELYVKLIQLKDRKEIIISRIILKKTKEGIGTEILKIISKFGEKNDYQILTIDSPNTDCKKFMKKMGFEPDKSWSLRTNQLIKNIQKYEEQKKYTNNLP